MVQDIPMSKLQPANRRLRRTAAALFGLPILFVLWGWTNEIPLSSPESIGRELVRHVRTLAADDMTGRGVDTPGIDLARDYIAGEFKRYGLAPGGDGGRGYFQRLEVTTGVEMAGPNNAVLGKEPPLVLDTDWSPLGLSASGTAEGELVFAGYGITAQDYAYDDYAGLDAKGKIVVVLRYEPPPKNGDSPFRASPRASRHATLQAKAANARAHGAAGLILVDLAPREGRKELISLRRTMDGSEGDLIAVQIGREIVERRLQDAGLSLRELKGEIDREEKPHSTPIPSLRAVLTVALKKIVRTTDNVVAVLPGSDPKVGRQNIVIGAHYDHLGLGHYGSMDPGAEGQIHNGADDNASGVAVMLSLAARLARAPAPPPRTIVFVAFTGEELGLYGSKHFVEHPPFPLASTRAMINLDMVGRMKDNKVTVASVDSAKEFRALLERAGRAAGGLNVEMKPRGGATDHVSFYNKQVPAVHFYTGMHPDYHRPSDKWEKLNIEGMARVGDMVLSLVNEIAAAGEGLTFVKLPSSRDGRPPPAKNP